MRTVLFFRHYTHFTGGHLKVWDYFNHVLAAPDHTARIRFTGGSIFDKSNPWTSVPDLVLPPNRHLEPDIFFVDGTNWGSTPQGDNPNRRQPVISLIQHVRHAHPTNKRYPFLSHRAIRICVAPEVATAITATGIVNGPIFTIPNGIALDEVHFNPGPDKPLDLLVVGVKTPSLARKLGSQLRCPERNIAVLIEPVPRSEFLRLMADSRVTVFLPNPTEGFYLPALEGLAAGTLVVCPDVVGNRGFCHPNETAIMPANNLDALAAAAETALAMPPEQAARMRDAGHDVAQCYTLAKERAAFHDILLNIDDIWAQTIARPMADVPGPSLL